MKLAQLQQLVMIHQYGSFTKAAQALYISQPALSMSIRELEEELGETLILRTNRTLSFTPVGEQVLEHAVAILEETRRIFQSCQGTSLSGVLTFAATPHHCASLLLPMKLQLEARYPGLAINLVEQDSRSTIEDIFAGVIDAGLVQLCDIGDFPLTNEAPRELALLQPLFEESMSIVVCESHPLLQREKTEIRELIRYPYTAYKKADNRWVNEFFRQQGRQPHILRVNDTVPLRLLISKAKGFTIIPKRAVAYGNEIYKEKLLPLNVPEVELKSPVSLVISRRQSGHVVNSIRDTLLELLKEY